MKHKNNGGFYTYKDKTGKEVEYHYSMDVTISACEATSGPLFIDFDEMEKIEISKPAFILATLRTYPQTEREVEELIQFSNGGNIKLSLFERILIWLKT
jgi:hypothetical protein